MAIERMAQPPGIEAPPAGGPEATGSEATGSEATGSGTGPIPAGLRLQILTTEHWSLLATRSLSWNESFSRAGMFLTALTGSVVALALVAQATTFGDAFVTFAMVILPVVFFLGLATFVRLVEVNAEDTRWVAGMNRLRHAYLELAPDLEPYFISGSSDDARGLMITYTGLEEYSHSWLGLHGFVTTPATIGIIDAVVAAVLVGVVAVQLGVSMLGAVAVGAVVFALLIAAGWLYTVRSYAAVRRLNRPRFPGRPEAPPVA